MSTMSMLGVNHATLIDRKEGLLPPTEVAKAFLHYVSNLWLNCLRSVYKV
jgi:hypothetical protein